MDSDDSVRSSPISVASVESDASSVSGDSAPPKEPASTPPNEEQTRRAEQLKDIGNKLFNGAPRVEHRAELFVLYSLCFPVQMVVISLLWTHTRKP
jgi:hypothetical protein